MNSCPILKADEPEIYNVRFSKYASRDPKQQFYVPATEPLSSEGKNISHGGIYYDRTKYEKTVYDNTMYHSLPFLRKVRDKKAMLSRIEHVTKTGKADNKPRTANAKKRQVMKEDMMYLANMMAPPKQPPNMPQTTF